MFVNWLCLIFFCYVMDFYFAHARDLKFSRDIKDLDDKLMITLLSPLKTATGEVLLEGDIAVTDNDLKALPGKGALWNNRVIPYEFHSSVSSNTTEIIKEAMREWTVKTCLQFAPRKNEKNYLRFRTDYPGCYTLVGRKYSGGQDVNLGDGCQHLQIAMHEIGHSLGFFHEHSRRDRDSTLRILWQNIQSGMTSQFQTGNDNPRGVPYDVTSVMHYSPMAFSSKIFEKNTMVSLDPHLQPLIGKSKGITFRDAKLANILYQCDDSCPNRAFTKCKNEGYLSPFKGGDCSCVCPPNTKGQFCEDLIGSYYGIPECGGDITDERIIETPGYPKRSKEESSCTWKLQAPTGMRISINFLDFSFKERLDKPSSPYDGLCVYEHVELRNGSSDVGDMYCGTDIAPSTKIVSASNVFWILITSNGSGEGRGLRAKITHLRGHK